MDEKVTFKIDELGTAKAQFHKAVLIEIMKVVGPLIAASVAVVKTVPVTIKYLRKLNSMWP